MKYDGRKPGNGWWNCPFSPAWVERMKRAAKACERLNAEQVKAEAEAAVEQAKVEGTDMPF